MVGFVGKTQSIVVGFVVKMQSIVVECLRLDSGLPIITADFALSLQAPSLRQQLRFFCSICKFMNVSWPKVNKMSIISTALHKFVI